jgi:hypothetical protein
MTLVDDGRRSDVVEHGTTSAHHRPRVRSRGVRRRSLALVAIAVVVLAVPGGALARSQRTPPPASPGAVLATRDQLVTLAASSGHAIYWAGERGRSTFETTVVGRDVYVRYLSDASEVGGAARRLTVGTYERADAYRDVSGMAAVAGATSRRMSAGALVVVPAGSLSAYFAFQGSDLLMEVYDPTPGRAFALVTSGAVQPVDVAASTATGP